MTGHCGTPSDRRATSSSILLSVPSTLRRDRWAVAIRLLLLAPATVLATTAWLLADALLPITLAQPQPAGLSDWIGATVGYSTIYGAIAVAPCVFYAFAVTRIADGRRLSLAARIVLASGLCFVGAGLLVAVILGDSPNALVEAVEAAAFVAAIGFVEGALDWAVTRVSLGSGGRETLGPE